MRIVLCTLAAVAGVTVSLMLAGGSASSGSPACPLINSPLGQPRACGPLPTQTTFTETGPISPPISSPVPPGPPTGLPTHPAVRPRLGHRSTTFHVYGTIRVPLGAQGYIFRDYRVTVGGHAHPGCGAGAQQRVSHGAPAQVFRVALAPPPGRWCRGRYRGAVVLEGGPYCPAPLAGEPLKPCPAFASVAQRTGRFVFRVR